MALPSERVFYTEPQQRWMGSPNSPLDHGMSPFGTEGTFHLRLPMSAHWARPDVSRTCPYRRV